MEADPVGDEIRGRSAEQKLVTSDKKYYSTYFPELTTTTADSWFSVLLILYL